MTARPSRAPLFVQQLHRAAAQRGKLDPVYQDLSDHWTQILQRLYPVWALIGPGLSDPGHIEIHSRTIYLDSETLLGPRADIAAGIATYPGLPHRQEHVGSAGGVVFVNDSKATNADAARQAECPKGCRPTCRFGDPTCRPPRRGCAPPVRASTRRARRTFPASR